jgi:hypothetical protein
VHTSTRHKPPARRLARVGLETERAVGVGAEADIVILMAAGWGYDKEIAASARGIRPKKVDQ